MPKLSTTSTQRVAIARKLNASRNTANVSRQAKSVEPIANAKSAKMDITTMTVCMEKRIDSKTQPKSRGQ
jgi:hypothetical protein